MYANWVAPEVPLEFNTKEPATGAETPQGVKTDNTYLEPIKDEYIPGIVDKKGYKFQTWYYFATEADYKANPQVKS